MEHFRKAGTETLRDGPHIWRGEVQPRLADTKRREKPVDGRRKIRYEISTTLRIDETAKERES